ncbi:uncharacterized protein LOC121976318 isoform X1 [Zingiber officinale]|uniref:Uncharacterized protein n=1 Tax=Zingiber officinale TaxID=94328 RepID=A0A8J5LW85_ZINOF|nr:uncharacterized protein LOC121976318 isoform X1 [Zingiber officinale]KAG6533232.1 hypothetical protein ZIOFF_007098 [Zingiber officinale]
MKPFVQMLSQAILLKETIMTELLDKVKIEAILSLEPILSLTLTRKLHCPCNSVTYLAAEVKNLNSFLPRLVDSLVILLKNGGDRDPEIIEQIFTSWSYIMMYLQKCLARDLVYAPNATATEPPKKPQIKSATLIFDDISKLFSLPIVEAALILGVRKAIRVAAKPKAKKH